MDITRRTLLKGTAAAAALLPFAGISSLAFAQEARQTLVVVFLRGGCDSLNLVAPVNDPNYIAERTPDMRVLDAGDRAGLVLANGLAPGTEFRWAPEAKPLDELYRSGRLAVVHAAGLQNGTRSHFVAQDFIERGIADDAAAARTVNGWLARYLASTGVSGAATAVSASSGVARSLEGYGPALAVPNLGGGIGLPGGDQAKSVLKALYPAGAVDQLGQATVTMLANMDIIDQHLPRTPDHKIAPYQPENNAAYDGNDIGNGLQTVARLIKMDVGLHVAAVECGGWDTHEHQPGRFSGLVTSLAKNLAAFQNDTARYGDRVTVVTVSEFGRRLRANKSQGTDHGHAGVMMVMGGRINGGRMYGKWPGLATPQLDHSVDLAATTDNRAVLGEILAVQLGARPQLGTIFPGYALPSSMGLVKA